VKLESGDQLVERRVNRYEYQDASLGGERYNSDANWLVIHGDVLDGEMAWQFDDCV
jgi:hypothetical protein